ncbi:LPS-assembly lptD [Gossypium arboreum]|uniref:LPS-assembly lptD n=1 Tax=Gossypium arboreum TaxID=29729 RepID=A0A0B0MSX2_GOSAR|nr:LPS-assembly lptD [Gossypium arboreum]
MFTRCTRDCSFKWEHCENDISELKNYIYVSNMSSNSLNPYVLIALQLSGGTSHVLQVDHQDLWLLPFHWKNWTMTPPRLQT